MDNEFDQKRKIRIDIAFEGINGDHKGLQRLLSSAGRFV